MAAHKPIQKERLSVNLLFPQGVPEKLPIKFLKWLVSYGRFIAILVEIIVISAFVARFKLDSDTSYLKDKITEQKNYVDTLSDDEARVRQIQFKLSTIAQNYNQSPDWDSFFSEISKQITPGVKLSSINLTHDQSTSLLTFRLVGTATSNSDLEGFLGGLSSDNNFKKIYLANVVFDQGQITFTITGGTTR